MRAVLVTLCAALLALPAPRAHASVWAVEPAGPTAEELYEDGRKDYRLGRFQSAIDKWEQAYAQAELPLLLYNIALAYRQLYDVTAKVDDLRKGKVVLRNFLVVAERDPDVDPADGAKLMEEIDELIAKAQAAGDEAGKQVPTDPLQDKPVDPHPVPEGPDPGRTRKIAGAVTMGVGGGLVLGGLVLGIVYGLEGARWRDALGRAQDQDAEARNDYITETNMSPDDNPDDYEEFSKMRCTQSDGRTPAAASCPDVIAQFRANGQGSNRVMGLGLGLLGGIGIAAIVAGAVVYAQGNKRTERWRRGEVVRRSLRLSPAGAGLSLSGRF